MTAGMRVAVTGARGSIGRVVVRHLLASPRVDEVVGIDVVPGASVERRRDVVADVRSPEEIGRAIEGCDAVVHLAFVIFAGRDPAAAEAVNVGGTRNVVACAARAGVRRLVVASSMAVYGVEDDREVSERGPLTTTPRDFYSRQKRACETVLDRWEAENHGAPSIARLRIGFAFGPEIDNLPLDMLAEPVLVLPDDLGWIQLVHEGDLGRAFEAALLGDATGAFHVTTEDAIDVRSLAAMHGQRLVLLPTRAVKAALDAAHALRVTDLDGSSATFGDPIGRPVRAKHELGWEPSMSTREAAYVFLAQRGRPLLWPDDAAPRAVVFERALSAVPAPPDYAVTHAFVGATPGARVHVEIARARGVAEGAIVVLTGLGANTRHASFLAAALAARGIDVAVVELPGHGASEGARGLVAESGAVIDALSEASRLVRRTSTTAWALLGLGSASPWIVRALAVPEVDARVAFVTARDRVVATVPSVLASLARSIELRSILSSDELPPVPAAAHLPRAGESPKSDAKALARSVRRAAEISLLLTSVPGRTLSELRSVLAAWSSFADDRLLTIAPDGEGHLLRRAAAEADRLARALAS